LDIREFKSVRLIKCKNPTGADTTLITYVPNESNSFTAELQDPVKIDPKQKTKKESMFWLSWDDVLTHFNYINLCWNPDIYPFKKRVHSKWFNEKDINDMFCDETYSLENNPQFVITIPPHKEDFEVRIFLQRHIKNYAEAGKKKHLSFKLFSYDGFRIIYPHDNLRSFNYAQREMCSDVFIFENSDQPESYILAILKGDNIDNDPITSFTLDVCTS
jgi:hypothetical protein